MFKITKRLLLVITYIVNTAKKKNYQLTLTERPQQSCAYLKPFVPYFINGHLQPFLPRLPPPPPPPLSRKLQRSCECPNNTVLIDAQIICCTSSCVVIHSSTSPGEGASCCTYQYHLFTPDTMHSMVAFSKPLIT